MITIDTTITQSIQQAVAIIRQGRALERMLIEAGFSLTDVDGEHHPKPSNGAASEPDKANSTSAPESDQKAPEWPQANADGELIDVRGIVWDGRIHSSSKGCNDDGSWRRRRGVDPKLVDRYEREAMAKGEPETVTLHNVMTAIDAAETAEDLARAVEPAQALPDDEKEQARTYYRERRAAIVASKAETANDAHEGGSTDPHPTEDWGNADQPDDTKPLTYEQIREGMSVAKDQEVLDAWAEESRHIVITPSQRATLDLVYDQRMRQLNAEQAAA